MIRYIYRTLFLLLSIIYKPGKLDYTDTSIIKWRILPGDLDLNLHLNNGAALTIMDFGRHDLSLRSGCLKHIIRDSWRPIIGSSLIRFYKSMPPFGVFELHSSIICWDEKWLYYEQIIIHKGELVGRALLKGIFRNSRGLIPPDTIASTLGFNGKSPEASTVIQQWKKIEF